VGRFERLAGVITAFAGHTSAFLLAMGVVLVWMVTGPFFHYSETWQLVINTGTTIVTFLMVFLIQRSQNKEAMAVQLKLNEVVAALAGASNHMLNVEDLGEEELATLHRHYGDLAARVAQERDARVSHSVEEETPSGQGAPTERPDRKPGTWRASTLPPKS
jgi:low affinity Fe/Cu permease